LAGENVFMIELNNLARALLVVGRLGTSFRANNNVAERGEWR
jgi:hypothetical protein